MDHEFDASVVIVTADGPEALGRLLQALAKQTIAHRLEILIAVPERLLAALSNLPGGDFGALRVIEADISTSARGRAAAITEARGPVIIFGEDHAFPLDTDWGERQLAAHARGHAAVGPLVINANPATATSWATLFVEYGEWIEATRAGEAEVLPGHNSSYRRNVLLAYGNCLSDMLEAEWVLHRDLRRKGETLWHDPEIIVEHLNYSKLPPAIELQFLAGRMFAASRAREWGAMRRAVFAGAFPLIAMTRLTRYVRRHLVGGRFRGEAFRALPAAGFILLVSAVGEGLGYAIGDGGRRSRLAQLEYERWRNLRDDEADLQRATSTS